MSNSSDGILPPLEEAEDIPDPVIIEEIKLVKIFGRRPGESVSAPYFIEKNVNGQTQFCWENREGILGLQGGEAQLSKIDNNANKFEIHAEKILNERVSNGNTMFLVKWSNVARDYATWSERDEISDINILQDFQMTREVTALHKPSITHMIYNIQNGVTSIVEIDTEQLKNLIFAAVLNEIELEKPVLILSSFPSVKEWERTIKEETTLSYRVFSHSGYPIPLEEIYTTDGKVIADVIITTVAVVKKSEDLLFPSTPIWKHVLLDACERNKSIIQKTKNLDSVKESIQKYSFTLINYMFSNSKSVEWHKLAASLIRPGSETVFTEDEMYNTILDGNTLVDAEKEDNEITERIVKCPINQQILQESLKVLYDNKVEDDTPHQVLWDLYKNLQGIASESGGTSNPKCKALKLIINGFIETEQKIIVTSTRVDILEKVLNDLDLDYGVHPNNTEKNVIVCGNLADPTIKQYKAKYIIAYDTPVNSTDIDDLRTNWIGDVTFLRLIVDFSIEDFVIWHRTEAMSDAGEELKTLIQFTSKFLPLLKETDIRRPLDNFNDIVSPAECIFYSYNHSAKRPDGPKKTVKKRRKNINSTDDELDKILGDDEANMILYRIPKNQYKTFPKSKNKNGENDSEEEDEEIKQKKTVKRRGRKPGPKKKQEMEKEEVKDKDSSEQDSPDSQKEDDPKSKRLKLKDETDSDEDDSDKSKRRRRSQSHRRRHRHSDYSDSYSDSDRHYRRRHHSRRRWHRRDSSSESSDSDDKKPAPKKDNDDQKEALDMERLKKLLPPWNIEPKEGDIIDNESDSDPLITDDALRLTLSDISSDDGFGTRKKNGKHSSSRRRRRDERRRRRYRSRSRRHSRHRRRHFYSSSDYDYSPSYSSYASYSSDSDSEYSSSESEPSTRRKIPLLTAPKIPKRKKVQREAAPPPVPKQKQKKSFGEPTELRRSIKQSRRLHAEEPKKNSDGPILVSPLAWKTIDYEDITPESLPMFIAKYSTSIKCGALVSTQDNRDWSSQEHKLLITALLNLGDIGGEKLKEVTRIDKSAGEIDDYVKDLVRVCSKMHPLKIQPKHAVPQEQAKDLVYTMDFFRWRKNNHNLQLKDIEAEANAKIGEIGILPIPHLTEFQGKFKDTTDIMERIKGADGKKRKVIVYIEPSDDYSYDEPIAFYKKPKGPRHSLRYHPDPSMEKKPAGKRPLEEIEDEDKQKKEEEEEDQNQNQDRGQEEEEEEDLNDAQKEAASDGGNSDNESDSQKGYSSSSAEEVDPAVREKLKRELKARYKANRQKFQRDLAQNGGDEEKRRRRRRVRVRVNSSSATSRHTGKTVKRRVSAKPESDEEETDNRNVAILSHHRRLPTLPPLDSSSDDSSQVPDAVSNNNSSDSQVGSDDDNLGVPNYESNNSNPHFGFKTAAMEKIGLPAPSSGGKGMRVGLKQPASKRPQIKDSDSDDENDGTYSIKKRHPDSSHSERRRSHRGHSHSHGHRTSDRGDDGEVTHKKKKRKGYTGTPTEEYDEVFTHTILKMPYTIRSEHIVYNLGIIPEYNRKYCNSRYIYPIGFHSERVFESVKDYTRKVWYRSEILEGDGAPVFRVTMVEDESIFCDGETPTKPWIGIMEQIEAKKQKDGILPRVLALSGPDYYGLSNKQVRNAILSLPGAEAYKEVKRVIHVVRGVIKRRSPAPRSVEDDYSSRACIERLDRLESGSPRHEKTVRAPRTAERSPVDRSPQKKAEEKAEKKDSPNSKAQDNLVLDLGRLLKPAEPEREEEKDNEENGGGEETGAFNLGIFSGMSQDALMDALDE